MAKDSLLKTDGVQDHFQRIIYPSSQKPWANAGMDKIFGKLQVGSSRTLIPSISGPEFLFIYPENAQIVISRLKPGQHASVGGICFLHSGMVFAGKRVVDKRGRRRMVYLDLAATLPKEVFPGGRPLQKSDLIKLNGAKISDKGWRLYAPGVNQGAPLGMVNKIFRYFETARATGTNLKIVVPTFEYTSSVIASMRLLHMEEEKGARQALQQIAKNYREVFGRIQRDFFPEVKLDVVMTHSSKYRAEINRFARKHPEIMKIQEGATNGFASAFSPEQRRIIRRSSEKESASYRKLFSYFFSTREPIIFMLHGRDLIGYPLEGFQAAEMVVGRRHLSKNVLFLGVPGGPGVAAKDSRNVLLAGYFGGDSKRLGKRDSILPDRQDARTDDYFARRAEKATSDHLPKHVGEQVQNPAGRCPSFIYTRTLGHYVGVKEGPHKVKQGLGRCFANSSHKQCGDLLGKTHSRLKRKLHPPKRQRRVQHRR
ncbi:hypothetical protein KKG83_04865 [Candidatus Micrarchaeota archaeon]|nr:hypothetical protein [Candidatus Micrarchaeota archaeon]MBU2476777.1 hypothetical protein [Candidatus Micrarchaeota archaeon]